MDAVKRERHFAILSAREIINTQTHATIDVQQLTPAARLTGLRLTSEDIAIIKQST